MFDNNKLLKIFLSKGKKIMLKKNSRFIKINNKFQFIQLFEII